jgi:preprotein translocase subunit SecG
MSDVLHRIKTQICNSLDIFLEGILASNLSRVTEYLATVFRFLFLLFILYTERERERERKKHNSLNDTGSNDLKIWVPDREGRFSS